MNQLPIEVTSEIISRLSSVKEKVLCKTLCKYWKDAAVAAFSRQECLSFQNANGYTNYMPHWEKCWGRESHVFNKRSQLNIKLMDSNRFRRKFFSEFCRLKVIRFPEDENFTSVWKYYLTEGPYEHLQCLLIYHLEFPVNLPNLRHFSCDDLTTEVLNSIIINSPHLTQLTIDISQQLTFIRRKKKTTEDFSDVMSRLPLGLKYLRIICCETDVFAVLSSPAMTTIQYLYFDKILKKGTGSFDKLTFCPSPNLETFGINGTFSEDRKCSNTLLHYLKRADNVKKVELSTTWLSVEDKVTLLKKWSEMTMIKLGMMGKKTGLDELIDVIFTNHCETLDTLDLGDSSSLNRDSWEKLGNFGALRSLICFDSQVKFMIFERQKLIYFLKT